MRRTIHDIYKLSCQLDGCHISTVAATQNINTPTNLKTDKGFIGAVVEAFLGTDAGCAPLPDFVSLGLELKTIPVDKNNRARETTFVSSVHLPVRETDFEQSSVAAKLRHVLWVPYHAAESVQDMKFGQPVLWQPSTDEWQLLKDDWEMLMEALRFGDPNLTGSMGEALHLRPKAANSRKRVKVMTDEGYIMTVPKGFYLRTSFTNLVLARA